MNEFKCEECGSIKLGYKKYVKCTMPVEIANGQITYGLSTVDEDNYLATCNGFCCMDCQSLIEYCGCNLETEEELRGYYNLDPKLKQQQQDEYDDIIKAKIEAQEELGRDKLLYEEESV